MANIFALFVLRNVNKNASLLLLLLLLTLFYVDLHQSTHNGLIYTQCSFTEHESGKHIIFCVPCVECVLRFEFACVACAIVSDVIWSHISWLMMCVVYSICHLFLCVAIV